MKIGDRATYQKAFTQDDFDRFAALSGDDNPIHVDPEFSARTKFGKTVAHGMLLYSTISRCLGTLLPGPGTVQAFQELTFPNPTFAGQEIRVELEVVSLSPPEIELVTEIAQSEGKKSCLGRARVWQDGGAANFEGGVFKAPVYEDEIVEHRGLELGQVAEKERLFTHAQVSAFLDLIDETNPVFTDPRYARSRGFKDVLLPGGLLGGMVSDLLGTRLPGRGTNWLMQTLLFLKPIYPEEELTARVEILRIRPEKELVNLRTTLTGPYGEVLVDGEALVQVSDLEQ